MSDAFLAKYSSSGSLVWTKQLGSVSWNSANALVTGSDGSIYIAGDANASIDSQSFTGATDSFVAKYSTDGTKLWTAQFGSSGVDIAKALTVGLDGSIYVAGETKGTFDGLVNSGTLDAFIFKLTAPKTISPQISIVSNKASVIAGSLAEIDFILSEASTTFTVNDISVGGGSLINFSGSGSLYKATFVPNDNSVTDGVISVQSGTFSNASGVLNADGSEPDNTVILQIDTIKPTIALSAINTKLKAGESILVSFSLSELSTTFTTSDITVTGGTITSLTGSGTSYSATFTLATNSTSNGSVFVPNNAFSDISGNNNNDGSESNNYLSFVRSPLESNEVHTLTVIVDKNVLGTSATLLKELKEYITYTNGKISKHSVEFAGMSFDYDQIDPLITTVIRDGDFTAEFTKEINDYLNTELNITYSVAVALVGAINIDSVILSVAGADGNYVF